MGCVRTRRQSAQRGDAFGVGPFDQRAGDDRGACLGTGRVVSVSLGPGGVPQGPEDWLRNRGNAVRIVAGAATDDCPIVGGGGDAAELAGSGSSARRERTTSHGSG